MRGIIHRMKAAAAGLAVSARRPAAATAVAPMPVPMISVVANGSHLPPGPWLSPERSSDRPIACPAQPMARGGDLTVSDPAAEALRQSLSHLSEIAELQRLELARLLDQNRRLNSRIDRLLILQQRDHAWRERLAGTLQHLAAASRSQAVETGRIAAAEARYAALRQSVGQLVGQMARHGAQPPHQGQPAIGNTTIGAPSPRR